MTTAVSGHEAAFAVGDLDGDGRPDLYFPDPDGSLTVYLGGERGRLPTKASPTGSWKATTSRRPAGRLARRRPEAHPPATDRDPGA